MPDIVICDLVDFPHCLPTISDWFYQAQPELYRGRTKADIEQAVRGWLQRDCIPTALVAVAGDEVIGSVALKSKELVPFSASPWVCGLYVLPTFRNCGVGGQLLRAAEDRARSMGLRKLYLYTPGSEGFYDAYGWLLHQEVPMVTGKAVIMEKLLTPQNFFQPMPPAYRG